MDKPDTCWMYKNHLTLVSPGWFGPLPLSVLPVSLTCLSRSSVTLRVSRVTFSKISYNSSPCSSFHLFPSYPPPPVNPFSVQRFNPFIAPSPAPPLSVLMSEAQLFHPSPPTFWLDKWSLLTRLCPQVFIHICEVHNLKLYCLFKKIHIEKRTPQF